MTALPLGLKTVAIRAVCAGLRAYFQHMPGSFGKLRLWDSVVRRHILWRKLEIEARSRFGARFHGSFPDGLHGFLYFFGVWEPAITAIYRAALRPGDVVVDIGANVGTHALLASRLVGPGGQGGEVHAVEASPWIYKRLRENLAVNDIHNVRTYNLAATEKPGLVTMFLPDGGSNRGGTAILPGEAVVEGRPLPDIVPAKALMAARLIKIDVEGAEWLVVQGMREVLPRLRTDVEILVEVNPEALAKFGGSLDAFLAIFAEAGFEPFEIANSYEGRFYIEKPRAASMPLSRRNSGTLDLVFRRKR